MEEENVGEVLLTGTITEHSSSSSSSSFLVPKSTSAALTSEEEEEEEDGDDDNDDVDDDGSHSSIGNHASSQPMSSVSSVSDNEADDSGSIHSQKKKWSHHTDSLCRNAVLRQLAAATTTTTTLDEVNDNDNKSQEVNEDGHESANLHKMDEKSSKPTPVINWEIVANELGNYWTAYQCSQRWSQMTLYPRANPNLKPWTEKEVENLVKAQAIHGCNWSIVCQSVSGRSEHACKSKWRGIQRAKRLKEDANVKDTNNEERLLDEAPTTNEAENRRIRPSREASKKQLNEIDDSMSSSTSLKKRKKISHSMNPSSPIKSSTAPAPNTTNLKHYPWQAPIMVKMGPDPMYSTFPITVPDNNNNNNNLIGSRISLPNMYHQNGNEKLCSDPRNFVPSHIQLPHVQQSQRFGHALLQAPFQLLPSPQLQQQQQQQQSPAIFQPMLGYQPTISLQTFDQQQRLTYLPTNTMPTYMMNASSLQIPQYSTAPSLRLPEMNYSSIPTASAAVSSSSFFIPQYFVPGFQQQQQLMMPQLSNKFFVNQQREDPTSSTSNSALSTSSSLVNDDVRPSFTDNDGLTSSSSQDSGSNLKESLGR